MPSLTVSGCRIYRGQNGVVGIHAIRPVAIGDKYLYEGKFEGLTSGQRFILCDDEGEALNEYEIQM